MSQLFWRQIVDVLIERIAGANLVLDTIDGGHQDGRKGKVGIAGAIRASKLDSLGARMAAIHRDANSGGTIALGIG